jgi:uncharacterized protein (TIRG00374 family)
MKQMAWRRGATVLFGVVVSLAALTIVVTSVDLATTASILARADPLPVIGALGLLLVSLTLRATRWAMLLPADDAGRSQPVTRIAPVMLIGYLGNAAMPARLGEVLRAYLVGRRQGIPFATAMGTVVLERVIDTAVLAAMASGAAFGLNAPAWVSRLCLAVATVATLVIMLLATGVADRFIALIRRRLGWQRRLSRAIAWAAAMSAAMSAQGLRRIGVAAALSAAAWSLDTLVFWLVAQALGIDLTPPAALVVAAVTVLGTAIPSAPGYIGTFELAASAIAVAFGVPAAEALALGVLAHVVTLVPIALGGIVAAAMVRLTPADLGDARLASQAR